LIDSDPVALPPAIEFVRCANVFLGKAAQKSFVEYPRRFWSGSSPQRGEMFIAYVVIWNWTEREMPGISLDA
jgi:hypothetical protein